MKLKRYPIHSKKKKCSHVPEDFRICQWNEQARRIQKKMKRSSKFLAFDMLVVSRKSIIILVPVATERIGWMENGMANEEISFRIAQCRKYSMKTNEGTYKTWKYNEPGLLANDLRVPFWLIIFVIWCNEPVEVWQSARNEKKTKPSQKVFSISKWNKVTQSDEKAAKEKEWISFDKIEYSRVLLIEWDFMSDQNLKKGNHDAFYLFRFFFSCRRFLETAFITKQNEWEISQNSMHINWNQVRAMLYSSHIGSYFHGWEVINGSAT